MPGDQTLTRTTVGVPVVVKPDRTSTASNPDRTPRLADGVPAGQALRARERSVLRAAEDALLDERRLLSTDELAELAALPDGAVMALASLAHQVRLSWCGPA